MGSFGIVAPLIRPRTDGQLHAWMKHFLGIDVPRVAVCEDRGHVSPFEFLARAFFEEMLAGASVGPRGGGKTRGVAALHLANSIFKAGCWTCHVGAIEAQANRCRDYVNGYARRWPWNRMVKRDPGTSITEFWNDSKTEVLPGTENAVSGPRPQKATFDEIEFWKWSIYQQALGMISSEEAIMGQLLLTSTRQKMHGTMHRIIEQAPRTGMRTFIFCLYEVMQPCPVGADPTRKGKGCPLFEAKDPKTGLGRCEMRVKGEVHLRCQRAHGHVRYPDVLRTFGQADTDTWETQQEALRPTRRGLVYDRWDREVNVRADRAEYRPGFDVLFGGDWGWSNPTVILFIQTDWQGRLWVFDEEVLQYKQIGEILDAVEKRLRRYPGARPTYMWADASDPGNCAAFRQRFRGLKVNPIDKEKGAKTESGKVYGTLSDGLKEVRRLIRDAAGNTWLHVHPRCIFTIQEFDFYHNKELGQDAEGNPLYSDEPEKQDDHALDALRYCASGVQRKTGRVTTTIAATPMVKIAAPTILTPPVVGVRGKEF